jgi:L-aminopeptidase/D-esterase-like protein
VPGGLGTAAVAREGTTVGAVAAVNAFGEIVDEDGAAIAGTLPGEEAPPFPTNTTLCVVATDAILTRDRAHRLAAAAHQGLARTIRPAHTMWDGDAVFTLATGRSEASQPLLERMAVEAVADAIRRAVRPGEGPAGPSAREEGES